MPGYHEQSDASREKLDFVGMGFLGGPTALDVCEGQYSAELSDADIATLDTQIQALEAARQRLLNELAPYSEALETFKQVRAGYCPKSMLDKYKEKN